MLCDPDLNISYVNPAVVELLRSREAVLRSKFPGFSVDNLIGQNIDQFHVNPQRQRNLWSARSNLPARTQISVADLDFEVNATAVVDGDGALLGNMVEWIDITEQKNGERELQNTLTAAAAGNFDMRFDGSKYRGFMRVLGDGVNALIDSVVRPLDECSQVMLRTARGDLTHVMAGPYEGRFATLQDAVNETVRNLSGMVEEIRASSVSMNSSADEAATGNSDLSKRTES